jgi:hypothetical protein
MGSHMAIDDLALYVPLFLSFCEMTVMAETSDH